MQSQVQKVLEKLEDLTPERLAEVEDYIDFLRQRDQGKNLRKNFTQASESAFSQVWNNDSDAIYDTI